VPSTAMTSSPHPTDCRSRWWPAPATTTDTRRAATLRGFGVAGGGSNRSGRRRPLPGGLATTSCGGAPSSQSQAAAPQAARDAGTSTTHSPQIQGTIFVAGRATFQWRHHRLPAARLRGGQERGRGRGVPDVGPGSS
jgi:hypothetical protein